MAKNTDVKKKGNSAILMLTGVVVVIILVIVIVIQSQPEQRPTEGYFVLNNRSYALTQVDTNISEWEQGLMNVTNMSNSTFALFVFPYSSNYPFWMKDTYVPLDMLWINNSKIVYIAANVPPCNSYNINQNNCRIYTPSAEANYVIEAKAGFAQNENVTVGENITIHLS